MPKQKPVTAAATPPRGAGLWDYASLFAAITFVVFLILNVYNRVLIIGILEDHSNGSVGDDTPLHLPLIAGAVTSLIGLLAARRRPSVVWIVAVTILITGAAVWALGLKLATSHAFQA